MKPYGIVLNIDINSVTTPFLTEVTENGRVPAIEELWPFVDIYSGTDVTDIAFCTFCQYSAAPSAVFSDAVFKRYQTEENGVRVDYTDRYAALAHLYEHGIDPYRVWFDRCREAGLRSWLSLRMNDCHEPDEDASFLRSEFFYEACANGWMIGSDYGYYRRCFDYAVPEVRAKMLAYIDEQLTRYAPDGLELDFMREPYCFNYTDGRDHAAIMNGFLREVKKLVTKAETRRGVKIPVLIRVPRDPETALAYGFDPVTWENEGLFDILNPTPRWETCDSDLPVARWKALLPKTEIYAGIEILVSSVCGRDHAEASMSRGYANHFLAEGADKIYLYNYYVNPHTPDPGMREVHRTCGTPAHTVSAPCRTIVTYQDIALRPEDRYQPLPLTAGAGETVLLSIGTGPIPGEAVLVLGCRGGCPEISVNGKPAEAVPGCPDDPYYRAGDCTFFTCTFSPDGRTRQHIAVSAETELTVVYAEIRF